MKPFEIFIAHILWDGGGKSRPVLMLLQGDDDIFIYPITTQYQGKSETVQRRYFKIAEWEKAGLNMQSYVDTINCYIVAKNKVKHKKPIGKLTDGDIIRFVEFLKNL
jgi:hypothetical protein